MNKKNLKKLGNRKKLKENNKNKIEEVGNSKIDLKEEVLRNKINKIYNLVLKVINHQIKM